MKPFSIRVPASSANIGPGFDSIGLALHFYLTLDVSDAEKWEIVQQSPHLPEASHYAENYIFQIANKVALRWHKELPGFKMTVQSDIPLARGLGSSASAIVAGIELANQVCGLSLNSEQKLDLGAEIEGHPDNIAPALFGGFIMTTVIDDTIDMVQLPSLDLDVVVFIPEEDLKTEAARKVLPDTYSRERAAAASSVSNVLVAALLTGDYALAGKMMENDLFHEPYRSSLIPNYDDIRSHAKNYGAYGTVISGAGPTMISFLSKGEGAALADGLKRILPDYKVEQLQIDQAGVTVNQRHPSSETISD